MALCVYTRELCNKCGRAVMRRDMKKHKQDARPKDVLSARYGDVGMQYECLDGHLNVCDTVPVPCA